MASRVMPLPVTGPRVLLDRFDALGWLTEFVAAGGSYVLDGSGRLNLFTANIDAEIIRRMSQVAGQPDRMDEVAAVIVERRR